MSRLAGHAIATYATWHAYRQIRLHRRLKRLLALWRQESYRLKASGHEWTFQKVSA